MANGNDIDQKLTTFYGNLVNSEEALEPDNVFFVPGLHASDRYDVVTDLAREMIARKGGGVFYFTGQRGTGKSTELRRLRTRLTGEGYRVFLVDMSEYLRLNQPVDISSLVIALCGALADQMAATYKVRFDKNPLLKRFSDWLTQTDVQLKDVSIQGFHAALNAYPGLLDRIREADRNAEGRLLTEARTFMLEIVEWVCRKERKEKVALLVDSLERLRGDDAESIFQSVVDVFGWDNDRLRFPGLHVVYSVPPYLSLLSDVRNYVYLASLACVRVFQTPEAGFRQPWPRGIDVMLEILDKRYPDWRSIIDEGTARRLAECSGGDLRQFMRRLVLGVLTRAYYVQDRLPLSAADQVVTEVLSSAERDTEALLALDEIGLVQHVVNARNAVVERRDQLKGLARLLDIRAVLNYRNGVEWFDANPLLWALLDKQAKAPAPAAAT